MKKIVFFGNIGVGKTTCGEMIEEKYSNVQFIEEDLSKNPFLPLFYDDMKKWGFHSSIAMLGLMSSYYDEIDVSKEIIILDQGVEELIAYTKLECDLGILTDDEYNIYKKMYDNICSLLPKNDLYVYFKCELSEELRRIKVRGRTFEKEIDYEFIYKLSLKYEEFVRTLPQEKLIIVDTTNGYVLDDLIKLIEEKINEKFVTAE